MLTVSVAINLILTLQYFITASPKFIDYLFNADLLFMHTLYDDFFVSGHGIKGWTFPGGQFFFPDMALYFLIRTFVEHPGTIYLIYVFVQQSLILFAVALLIRNIFSEGHLWIAAASILMFSLIPAIAIVDNDYLFPFYLYTVNFHVGAFLLTIYFFLAILAYYKSPRWSGLVLIFILVFLGYVSSKLFLLMGIVPSSIAFLIILLFGKHKRNWIKAMVVIASGFVLAMITSRMLELYLINVIKYNTKPDFANISFSVNLFSQQLFDYIKHLNIRSLVILNYFIVFGIGIWLFFKSLSKRDAFEMLWISMVIVYLAGVFLGPIITGMYKYTPQIRYNISVFYLGLIMLFPFLLKLNRTRLKTVKISTVFLMLIFGIIIGIGFTKTTVKPSYYSHYYPKYIQILDSLNCEYNLENGLSIYEYSTQIRSFSKTGLRVYNGNTNNLNCDYFLSNKAWYHGKSQEGERPVFNFLFHNKPLNDSVLQKHFSEKEYLYQQLGQMHFYLIPDYVYNDNRTIVVLKDSLIAP